MQLPDFIKRALAFFDKAEANLTAEQKLAQALGKIADLEKTAAADKESIGARDKSILDLQGQLKAANEKATSLEQDLAKAKKSANETIASIGLDPNQLPAAEANKGGEGSDKETAWETYHRLLDSGKATEAGQYYVQNAEKILQSRPKK